MRYKRGFTLIELIVTLAIAAIVTTFAVPGFREILRRNEASTQVNALLVGFKQARSAAVTRSAPVSICASADGQNCSNDIKDWKNGWIIKTNNPSPTVIHAAKGLNRGTTIDLATASDVRYQPSGAIKNANAFKLKFTLGMGSSAQVRCLEVSPQGRAETKKGGC